MSSREGLSLEQMQMAWGLKHATNASKAAQPMFLKLGKVLLLFPEATIREINQWMPLARQELVEAGILTVLPNPKPSKGNGHRRSIVNRQSPIVNAKALPAGVGGPPRK